MGSQGLLHPSVGRWEKQKLFQPPELRHGTCIKWQVYLPIPDYRVYSHFLVRLCVAWTFEP
jgi:hypothetical protein